MVVAGEANGVIRFLTKLIHFCLGHLNKGRVSLIVRPLREFASSA